LVSLAACCVPVLPAAPPSKPEIPPPPPPPPPVIRGERGPGPQAIDVLAKAYSDQRVRIPGRVTGVLLLNKASDNNGLVCDWITSAIPGIAEYDELTKPAHVNDRPVFLLDKRKSQAKHLGEGACALDNYDYVRSERLRAENGLVGTYGPVLIAYPPGAGDVL